MSGQGINNNPDQAPWQMVGVWMLVGLVLTANGLLLAIVMATCRTSRQLEHKHLNFFFKRGSGRVLDGDGESFVTSDYSGTLTDMETATRTPPESSPERGNGYGNAARNAIINAKPILHRGWFGRPAHQQAASASSSSSMASSECSSEYLADVESSQERAGGPPRANSNNNNNRSLALRRNWFGGKGKQQQQQQQQLQQFPPQQPRHVRFQSGLGYSGSSSDAASFSSGDSVSSVREVTINFDPHSRAGKEALAAARVRLVPAPASVLRRPSSVAASSVAPSIVGVAPGGAAAIELPAAEAPAAAAATMNSEADIAAGGNYPFVVGPLSDLEEDEGIEEGEGRRF